MAGVDSESIINYVRYNRETISSLSKFVRRTYRKEFTSQIYIPVLNKNKLCFNYFTGIHQDVRKESVIRIVVDSGKELKLTEDMEVYSSTVGWTRVRDIRVGDSIGTQGSPICLRCGKKRFLSGFIYRAMYKNICKTTCFGNHVNKFVTVEKRNSSFSLVINFHRKSPAGKNNQYVFHITL